MTNQVTNYASANGYESTLSSGLSANATTINVASTSGSPAVPFFLVVDPDNDSKREVILVDDGKTGTTFTLTAAGKRGQDGTSDVSHDSGAIIAFVPVGAMWGDLHDRVTAHAHGGSSDGAQVDHGGLGGLSDDDHTQYHNNTRHDARDHSTATGVPTALSDLAYLTAVKTADETVNNSATLQDDDHLSVSLAANSRYTVEMALDIDATATSAAQMKAAFTVPSGATLAWSAVRQDYDVVTGAGSQSGLGTATDREHESVVGQIETSTAGTLQFRWAQDSAEANNLVLKVGSWLRCVKLA